MATTLTKSNSRFFPGFPGCVSKFSRFSKYYRTAFCNDLKKIKLDFTTFYCRKTPATFQVSFKLRNTGIYAVSKSPRSGKFFLFLLLQLAKMNAFIRIPKVKKTMYTYTWLIYDSWKNSRFSCFFAEFPVISRFSRLLKKFPVISRFSRLVAILYEI